MRRLVVLCLLVVGCSPVNLAKTPQDLSIKQAIIPVENGATKVTIDGPSGKGSGAFAGGATGAGVGVGTVAVLSTACGPLYMFCLAGGSIFFGVPVGGVMGAAYGSATAEASVRVKGKQAMLTDALVALDASENLAPLVYRKSLAHLSVETTQGDKAPASAGHDWTLRIVLDEFATVGSGPDTPYALQLSASVEIKRLDDKVPAFTKSYQADSPLQMTTAQWRANDDEPVRLALGDLLATLATEISNDLVPIQLTLAKPVEDYRVSVKPVATDTKTEPAAVLAEEAAPSPSPGVQAHDNPDQFNLFDPTTRKSWVIVQSNPVNLGTATSLCATLETEDKNQYRVPSLSDFEELWEKYKNDGRINVFKKREYCTDSKEFISRSAYVRTFSFSNGSSGQLYAGYLTCVSK